jgi:iron(III) transport system ATP-binding protein
MTIRTPQKTDARSKLEELSDPRMGATDQADQARRGARAGAPAIECVDLHKSFDRVVAVRNFDLTVSKGELVVLFGPSGCGKSTALRLIAGLERPDRGSISLDGKFVAGPRWVPAEKRQVGLVFQELALFPHLNVRDNVAFGLGHLDRKERSSRVEEVLALVGMSDMGERMPHELSGGQQQRVALARALAPRPRVLLLDEPFSNLDASLREKLRHEVRCIIKDSNLSAIFVTHDVEEALSLGDRIAVMRSGTVLEAGTPDQMYSRPSSLDVGELLGPWNVFHAAVEGGEGLSEILGPLMLSQKLSGTVMLAFRPEWLGLVPDERGSLEVAECEFYGHDCMIKAVPAGSKQAQKSIYVREIGSGGVLRPGTRVSVVIDSPPIVFSENGERLDVEVEFREHASVWASN